MTQAELENLIREEVVLKGPYEGLEGMLLDRVQPLGLDIDHIRHLLNRVRIQLDNNGELLDELRGRIRLLGQRRAGRLTPDDLHGLAADAARLYLTPDFVRTRWVPFLLTGEAAPPPPAAAPEQAPPPPAAPPPQEDVPRRIRQLLDDSDGHVPVQTLRFLFRAIDHDEQALAEHILAYLSEQFYASVTTPRGQTLKEKLLSTDWRHLSYWERSEIPAPPAPHLLAFEATPATVRRGEAVVLRWSAAHTPSVTLIGVGQNLPLEGSRTVVPAKTTSYVLRDESGSQLGAVTVEVARPRLVDRAGLWGVLLALLMLGTMVWLIRHDSGEEREPAPPTTRRTEPVAEPVPSGEPRPERPLPEAEPPPAANEDKSSPDPTPEPDRPLPYDQLLEGSGDFGEQRAKKDGLWGLYLPTDDRWLIKPRYDDITVFNDGRARVILDGTEYEIDPSGQRLDD